MGYKWEEDWNDLSAEPAEGDIRLVNLQVQCLFEWSDKIVIDFDDEEGSEFVEHGSGWLMHVLPQTFVRNNEESVPFASTTKEKQGADIIGNLKLLKERPQKNGLSTEYACGLKVTGGWATRLDLHNEFIETAMGRYILELESELKQ